MAHHKSAKKRVRSDAKKNQRNHQYLASVRTAIKSFRVAVDELIEGKLEVGPAKTLLTAAQKMIAKAGSKGIMPSNTASRRIGRLAKLFDKTEKNVANGIEKTVVKKKAAKKKTTNKTSIKKKK